MSHVVLYTVAFMISLCLALTLTPLVIKLAYKVGAIDKPNHRKVHTKIMPRLGGLGIYGAFIGAYSAMQPFIPEGLFRSYDKNLINAMLTGGSMIVLIGVLDDRFELSAKFKLLGQIVAACVVVFGFGVKIELLNIPFGDAIHPVASWLSIPITILWIVGVTNAINLIDGLDGLAAGVSAIAIGTILVMAAVMGFAPVILLSLLLLGGVIGFLVYNFHPAKIFMGDTGSLFLGFGLATLSMLGFKQVTMVSFVTPLLIIGVPLSDTFFAIVRRWIHKKPIFAPDKGHLHHCLRELGFSHRRTVLIIYAIASFFGICAILQSTIVQSEAANWISFGFILVVAFFLQIGAELIGIVDKSRRPLISFLQRLLLRTDSRDRNNLPHL
ncbi:glycosyltransferase family 4 protein [Paenibacillus sp. R14(2021)]|uniref:glycosyltransferase family 4 protein n=1 Tax=Paenibacillus sp. R14(2021) TaxID=2859228 RepID=UPI001C6130B0|nr:MraY family glycosyltransferase [Paenibacillus sp. R14(2021)]